MLRSAVPFVRFVVFALAAVSFPAAREYRALKGESTLTYVLVHPLHTVKGVNRDLDCLVELSADTVSSKIRVSADVLEFDSGNSNRDSHAMEAVEYRKYPKVTFVSTSIRPAGDGYEVAGDLTFHGKTRPVAFRAVPKAGAERVEVTGQFAVKLSDFGVERPRLMLVPTKDELTIRFDLFATP
jgi:polyisoprenoid-binding protein YceI